MSCVAIRTPVLLLTWLFVVNIYTLALARTYYVLPYDPGKPNGNGGATTYALTEGGEGAWNGIEKLDWSIIRAGDEIRFKRGARYFGMIEIKKNGADDAPITLGAFGTGEAPIITGAKRLSRRSKDWRYEPDQSRWVCTRFEDGSPANGIYNAATLDGVALERAYSSAFKYFFGQFSNNRFKTDLFPNGKPWTHEILLSVLPYNLLIDGRSFITVSSLDFRLANGWSVPQYGSIHIVNGAHHISIVDCKISLGSFSGLWVVGSNHVTVRRCEIYSNYCTGLYFRDGASFAIITNNKIYDNGRYLSVNNTTDTGGLLMGSSGVGTGHRIEGNEIFSNGRATMTDRVDGFGPNGILKWQSIDKSVWKKDLSPIKRWAGTGATQGVHFFGKNNKPMKVAESKESLDQEHSWYWDRESECLFYFSQDDPNKTSDVLEIAWYNGIDPGISLWGITNSLVRNNVVRENYGSGIGVAYITSKNVTIENNIVEHNLRNPSQLHSGNSYGIHVSGQGGFVITGNIIRDNRGPLVQGNPLHAGLLMAASSISPNNNTTIIGNIIKNNSGFQLSWFKYLGGSVFENCKSDYNEFEGARPLFYYLNRPLSSLHEYIKISHLDINSKEMYIEMGP